MNLNIANSTIKLLGKKIKQNAGDNFSNLGERKTFITMIQNPETTELNCIKKKIHVAKLRRKINTNNKQTHEFVVHEKENANFLNFTYK